MVWKKVIVAGGALTALAIVVNRAYALPRGPTWQRAATLVLTSDKDTAVVGDTITFYVHAYDDMGSPIPMLTATSSLGDFSPTDSDGMGKLPITFTQAGPLDLVASVGLVRSDPLHVTVTSKTLLAGGPGLPKNLTPTLEQISKLTPEQSSNLAQQQYAALGLDVAPGTAPLVLGAPTLQQVLGLPTPVLSAAEQAAADYTARTGAAIPIGAGGVNFYAVFDASDTFVVRASSAQGAVNQVKEAAYGGSIGWSAKAIMLDGSVQLLYKDATQPPPPKYVISDKFGDVLYAPGTLDEVNSHLAEYQAMYPNIGVYVVRADDPRVQQNSAGY